MELSSPQIALINSLYEVRLELYKYLAIKSSYPFVQGQLIMPEFIDYVKFVLQYFTDHPNATWQDFHNTYLTTPCEKITTLLADTKFKEKFTEMTQSSVFTLNHEKVYVVKHPAQVSGSTEPQYISADLPDCTPEGGGNNAIFTDPLVYALMHDHQDKLCQNKDDAVIKIPSPIDIKTFFNTLLPHALTTTGSYGNAYSLVTTSSGNYMLMYTGNFYPSKIETAELQKLTKDYEKEFQELYFNSHNVTQTDIEQTFLKFIKQNLNRPGLQIYKVTQNSATKIEYSTSSPNNIKPTPCQ